MGKTGNRLSGFQKMSAVLSTCPAICERIFGGTLLYCINREDRRYTKKMTLANKSAIFLNFCIFRSEFLSPLFYAVGASGILFKI